MKSKIIKEIRFGLENMESVIVPYECFKGLSINKKTDLSTLKEGNIVYTMKCDITDNGNIEYGYSFDNEIYPLTRLGTNEDICHVDIIYKDDTKTELTIKWGESDYCSNNSNQTNIKTSYNEIHIEIKPYVQQYTIQEVFELDIFNLEAGRIIYGKDNKRFLLMETENDKYLDGQILNADLVNMKFTLIPIKL